MMRSLKRLSAVLVLVACSGCSLFVKADKFGSRPITYSELPGWNIDHHGEALQAFKESCPILARKARGESTGSGLEVSAGVWQSLCNEASHISSDNHEAARLFFERRFAPYRVNNNGKEQGLFTGYYEPTLYGSLKRTGNYKYPLYAPPAGLKEQKPYYTHAEINRGALKGRHLELVWVDDPVMIFFLHIQGSGRIILNNGTERLIGYADQNGHGYVSLGKVMGDEGLLPKDQINFFTLRQWLYDNPDRAFDMMEKNPSYVFFKWLDKKRPVGAIGAELTAQRSLAIDSRHIPYGLPLFLQTELPATPGNAPTPFNRLMIAQDTGGAIRGPVRGDIFFGPGQQAEYLAGYMKNRGMYNLLVPREIAYQLQ
jgi:membrane-bound lytic murein transglycosylase A